MIGARVRFALLAALAYAWLLKVVASAIGLTFLVVATAAESSTRLKTVVGAVGLALVAGWLRAARPCAREEERPVVGVDLDRDEAALLLRELGLASARAAVVPPFEEVRVTGGRRPRLVVGAPVLLGTTFAELSELLAAARRSRTLGERLDRRCARMAAAWRAFADSLEGSAPRLAFLSRRVVPWLAGRLERAAARLEPDRPCEERLSAIVEYLSEVHWVALWERVDLDAEPPTDAFSSLRQPLAKLGSSAELSAGETVFGASFDGILARLDALWRDTVEAEWRAGYAAGPGELDRLDRRERHGLLAEDEVAPYAALVERFRGAEEAEPLYERALEHDPEDAPSAFALGRLLLGRDDERGLALLDRAVAADPQAARAAWRLAEAYAEARGHEGRAAEYRRRAEDEEQRLEAAAADRAELLSGDRRIAHGLGEHELRHVREVVAAFPEVERAFVARKALREATDETPAYLVGAVRRPTGLVERRGRNRELARELHRALDMPGVEWIVVHHKTEEVVRWFRGVPGAEIFRRRRVVWRRRGAWCLAALFAVASLASAVSGPSTPPHRPTPMRVVAPFRLQRGDPIVRLEWSFGDGTHAVGRAHGGRSLVSTTTHVFPHVGTYAVVTTMTTRSGHVERISQNVVVSGRD